MLYVWGTNGQIAFLIHLSVLAGMTPQSMYLSGFKISLFHYKTNQLWGTGSPQTNHFGRMTNCFEAVFFPLIVQICFGTPQVDDLRAAFSVFFHQGTTFTVVRIRNTLSSANNTPAFIRTVIAFIAHSSEWGWADKTITNNASPVT